MVATVPPILVELVVQEEEVEMVAQVAQAILQVQTRFKDMLAAMVIMILQLMVLEEAAVLLKKAKMVLVLKVAMVEMELHLLYLVLQ